MVGCPKNKKFLCAQSACSMQRSCDVCQASPALVFCRADAAYLCMACDLKVHGANKLASRHERVWLCEVCEQAPAVVICKADAASLCRSCDADIHSANPLASRHERVPVLPFYDAPGLMKHSHKNVTAWSDGGACGDYGSDDDDDHAAEAESWLLPTDGINKNSLIGDGFDDVLSVRTAVSHDTCTSGSNGLTPPAHYKPLKVKSEENTSLEFFSDVDRFYDMQFVQAKGVPQTTMDSIVPVHSPNSHVPNCISVVPPDGAHFVDAEVSPNNGFSVISTSLAHSISSCSLEFGVVPDSACSDISTPTEPCVLPRGRSLGQLDSMAREARVIRYKERRKNRKFEKTIRYASRKAYAETRPRIKGRFAKRIKAEVEQMFSVVPDTTFGVVPSF